MRITLTILIAFLISSSIFAQNWTTHNSPRSRQIHGIHFHSPEKIVIVGGNPENDSITYMAYSSTAAESWDVFNDIFPGKIIKTLVFNNNISGFCAGYDETFYKTVDGGKNWHSYNSGVDLHNKNINKLFKAQYGVLYAVGGLSNENGFLMKSINSGNSWQSIYEWPQNEIIAASSPKDNNLIVAGANGFLQLSTDGGTSWQNCEFPDIGYTPIFTGISFFDENNGFCSGGVLGEDSIALIMKTIDGGHVWTIAFNSAAPCLNDISMASDQVVYAVGNNGFVLKSVDGGLNWIEEPIEGNPGEDLFTVNFLNTHIGAIAGKWGYLMVYNDGQSNMAETSTLEASNITNSTATLNAIINPGFTESEISFLYGTDESTDTEVSIGTFLGGNLQSIQFTLLGLEPNTKYYFRAKLNNVYGEYFGDIKYFYTGNPIPNWDFELWTEVSKDFPENWYVNQPGIDRIEYIGFNAIRLSYSSEYQNNEVAVIRNAEIEGDDIEEWHIPIGNITGGLNINSRPDSIFINAKYNIEDQDSALLFLGLILDDHYVSENYFFITGNQSGFQTLGFEIDYLTGETPNRAVIAITNSNPFSTPVLNSSSVEIADIYFSDNLPEIPNSNFSEWNTCNAFLPQDWHVDVNHLFDGDGTVLNLVERTTDAAHHEYAIKLQNKITEYDTIHACISLKDLGQGIPIDKRFSTLFGQFKYTPEGQDTANISIIIYQNGEQVGWGNYSNYETITNWTEFLIDIHYINPDIIPDSINIFIAASVNSPAIGESALYIDKLCFDGDFIPVEINVISDFSVYPNPFTDILHVNNINGYENISIEIIDLNGKIVYYKEIKPARQFIIDTKLLQSGFYLLKVNKTNKITTKKIIKL